MKSSSNVPRRNEDSSKKKIDSVQKLFLEMRNQKPLNRKENQESVQGSSERENLSSLEEIRKTINKNSKRR